MTLNHLLLPTDFSACADEALAYATELADRFGATLHLLHVVDEMDPDWFGAADAEERAGALRNDIERTAEARLRDLAARDGVASVETTVALRSSFEVDQAIVDYAGEQGIDLLVMGTHGRQGLDRLVLGSVTETVLRQAPSPVLTVRQGAGPLASGAPAFQNILAPIDFSDASHDALTLADGLAEAYRARLHLLFVAEERTVPTFSDTGLPGFGVVKMDPEIVDNAEAALRQLGDRLGGRAPDSAYHVREGGVASTITEMGEADDMDLVVMATQGRQGADRFWVGSTTERVVRRAPCPVLTMRARSDGNTSDV